MGRLPVITYDTVLCETPAIRATSLLVNAAMTPPEGIVDAYQ
jgi:hypothetical protein